MLIRPARIEDAVSACEAMRRSIAELCGADHHDDPEILRSWLANKTPKHWVEWLAYEGNTVLVAVDGETVLAVGVVRNDGEITCNYVSPDARFKSVSKAMMVQLEARARAVGHDACRLESTETARRFYLACGYEETGQPRRKFGTMGSYPMLKRFAVPGLSANNGALAISDLRLASGFFDAVADRIWRAWWEPRGFPLSYIRDRLRENMNADAIPFALVAHEGSTFLGTASVIASDLEDLPHYTPWVAAVWVDEEHRERQVGRALVARAVDDAFALGISPHLSLRANAPAEFLSPAGLAADRGKCRDARRDGVRAGGRQGAGPCAPSKARRRPG